MRYLTVRAYLTFVVSILGLGCANTPGPFCLSGVTTYVEGARGKTFGEASTEARAGVSLEWDPSREACHDAE